MKKLVPVIAFMFCLGISPMAHRQKPAPAFRYEFAPSTGELKILVILMRFPEDKPELSPERLNEIFFSKGKMQAGSLAEYFEEVSYGKLKITGQVRGWYTADHSHAFYAAGGFGHNAGRYPNNMAGLITEAVEKAQKDGVNFSAYDNSGDGHVDGLIVVHSGRGGDTSGKRSHIWTTVHYLSMGGTNPIQADEKTIDRYSIIQEVRRSGVELPIGFIAHETGHLMGLPDLAGRRTAGAGRCAVMGAGFWGQDDPTRPFHFCAWSKTKLGWITPTVITSDTIVKIPDVETHPKAFRLNTSSPDEYFLIINRQKKGYDTDFFGKGILIWHIDESVLTQNHRGCTGLCPSHHYILALEQADGRNDLEKNHNTGDEGDFFTLEPESPQRWAPDTGIGKDFLQGAHSMTYHGGNSGNSLLLLSGSTHEIRARVQVNDPSHPSPSMPLFFIAEFRMEEKVNQGYLKKEKPEFKLYLKIRNMGASADKINVCAEAFRIRFKKDKATLDRLETGEVAWLKQPLVFIVPEEFGPGQRTKFKFQVSANRGNYNTVLSKFIPAGTPDVLLLDDSERRIGLFYQPKLTQLKQNYWYHNVQERGLPGISEIRRIPALIWLAPIVPEGGEVLDPGRRHLLRQYLEHGGNILMVAPSLDFKNDPFWSETIHIDAARPEAGFAGINGIPGDLISRNHQTLTRNFYYPRINPHSSLTQAKESVAIYLDLHGHVVGTRYPADKEAGHRIVILGFPFEALGPGSQLEILHRIFYFFRTPFHAPVADMLKPRRIPSEAAQVKVTVSGINFQPDMSAHFKEKDIQVQGIKVIGQDRMELVLEIRKPASPGPRTLILANPGIPAQEFQKALIITEPKLRER